MNIFKWFKARRDNEYVTTEVLKEITIDGLLLDVWCKESEHFPHGYVDKLTIWDDAKSIRLTQRIDHDKGELYNGYSSDSIEAYVPIINRKVLDTFNGLLNHVKAIVTDEGNLTPIESICNISIRENLKKTVSLKKTIVVKRKDLV